MKKIIVFSTIFISAIATAYAERGNPVELDTTQIETLTGAKGELDQESNVFKVSVPQTALKVSAAGIQLTPALGLTSWAAFKLFQTDAEVIGDMVLLEDQINFVMKEALDNGLNITALHNRYLWENPKIMFMHIEGKGQIKDLAMAVGKIFEVMKKTTKGTIWNRPPSIINPARSTLTSKNIEDLFEKKGALKDGVYKLTWERKTQLHDHTMGAFMGVNTWATFAGTDRDAVMLGVIAMRQEEVQDVLKALLTHNIFILSLHQHSMEEEPRIVFVHYMGRGPAFELAKALKEALPGDAALRPKD